MDFQYGNHIAVRTCAMLFTVRSPMLLAVVIVVAADAAAVVVVYRYVTAASNI